ncbi:immunity 51 family protein [Nocardia yamanashiensis]|uniref:immunity 51 family protein n=1 Tax=Nocardia yamanashiensis TaxID=209247 RepID=UPI001E4824E2|nr:immunity 51 family protein [Nocardia yamanashiensis]UGT45502.1 immunity 51 family protein [Nocardia yamanashiensis]
MTDRETYAPLVFFEYDHKPGHYCLMLSDNHMVELEDVFAVHGYEGGGYSWTGVAEVIVRLRAPELRGRMGFDPEAGTFVAYGDDAAALRQLGTLLRQAFSDRELLSELIDAGEEEWFD